MNTQTPGSNHQLTAKQLAGYRQWLAELDEEAHEPGGDPAFCDSEVWQDFDPNRPIGRQVYESFSDEELLDILLRTMDRPGHSPRFDEVYCIYRQYLRLRFDGLNNAKDRAKARRKHLRDQEKWPADWWERVSPEPLIQYCRTRKREPETQDLLLFQELCGIARRCQLPPVLTSAQSRRLEALCGAKRALELMGIPALNKSSLRHMQRYWSLERTKQQTGQADPNKEDTS